MQLSFSVPDHLRLCGLEETRGGWMVYLRDRNGLYLQGRFGATPQEAIDACAKAMASRPRQKAVAFSLEGLKLK